MTREVYLQAKLFTGELVDTRNRKQKQREQERKQPQPVAMFSQRDMAEFGVVAKPKIPLSPKTRLELAMEDPRSEEEKQEDLRREIEKRTFRLLDSEE